MIPQNIHLGDAVTRRIAATEKKATGTVVYIHPLRRFYTVRFSFGDAAFLESYND